MYHKVALVCLVMVAVASGQTASTTTTTRRPNMIQVSINRLKDAAMGGFSIVNTTAQLGTELGTKTVSAFTGMGKQLVNSMATIKSAALQGGRDIVHQSTDVATNVVGAIPGVRVFADMGGNMVKAAADVGNMVGQSGISAMQGIANGKLSLVNGIVSTGAGMANSAVSLGTGMAKQGVEMGGSMASGIAGTAGAVVDSIMDRINNATVGVSSMANNIATSMSVSTPGTLTG